MTDGKYLVFIAISKNMSHLWKCYQQNSKFVFDGRFRINKRKFFAELIPSLVKERLLFFNPLYLTYFYFFTYFLSNHPLEEEILLFCLFRSSYILVNTAWNLLLLEVANLNTGSACLAIITWLRWTDNVISHSLIKWATVGC